MRPPAMTGVWRVEHWSNELVKGDDGERLSVSLIQPIMSQPIIQFKAGKAFRREQTNFVDPAQGRGSVQSTPSWPLPQHPLVH